MNTKKTIKNAKNAKNATTDIAKLNALFGTVQSTDEKLQKAYNDAMNALISNEELTRSVKTANVAMAAFNLQKKRMGAVKFDTRAGEYFPARNAAGQENFRIRVVEQREVVVPVSADTLEEACAAAVKMVEDGKVYLLVKPTTAENVSIPA